MEGSWILAKYQTASVTCTYRSGQPARQIEKAESPSAIRAMLDLDTSKIKSSGDIHVYVIIRLACLAIMGIHASVAS